MMNKLLNKICIGAAVLCSASVISSCTAGLTYEEAPESVYSEVGVSKIELKARELFNDKIYAVNWNKWVDNYIDTRLIGSSDVFTWVNRTGAPYTHAGWESCGCRRINKSGRFGNNRIR